MHPLPSGLIRAVAFDAVGTLIHPDPPAHEVYAAVGRQHGSRLEVHEIRTRFSAAFAKQERLDTANGFATSEAREHARWQQIVADVLDDVGDPAACFAQLYDHFARPDAWRCENGINDVVSWLRQSGYAIALASNYDQRLRPVIAGLADLGPIKTVVISSAVGWRKPDRRFFAALTAALGMPADAVLYIGDDYTNDFEGARQAGMPALLFDPRARRLELAHDRLDTLAELRLPGV